MCGIAGIFNFHGSADFQSPHVVRMAKAMKHRGPDDEGFIAVDMDGAVKHFFGEDSSIAVRSSFSSPRLISSALDSKSTLFMGHRRLSILDISPAGHQPMRDPTSRYWIVFNGEIFNFIALRAELEVLGHRFQTSSDTEVILAAYSQWRENCLKRFNGDFAFAIWDIQEQSLFCARDRIGIKPFYYILDERRFIFGSDIKTLIASGLHRPEPDSQGLYLAMAFGIAPRPITAFKGIRALEQAHWIRLHRDGRIEKERYWHIPIGSQERNMPEADAIELLEEHIRRAVALRLVADVPIGTFMSGGIDSTTISAIAARQHPGIKAFTLGYQNDAPEMDEVSQAKATASMHPMQHIIKQVNPEESLQDLRTWVEGYEEPFYSLAANHVLSKVVNENKVTVVLNGLGGDELFAGYDHYRFHLVPRLSWLHPLTRRADKIANRKVATLLRLVGAQSADRLHSLLFRKTSDVELHQLLKPSFHPVQETPDLLHNLYAKDLEFSDTLEAMSYMDLVNYIGNHHVHRIDQFTMAYSIEGRFPFLDHELIEAVYRIPSSLKMHYGKQKYILRRVAEKYIAPECLSMKKKGFSLPLKQWMQGPLKPLVNISLDSLRKRIEVESDVVTAWQKAYAHDRVSSARIWHLVALELWFEHFIDPGIVSAM